MHVMYLPYADHFQTDKRSRKVLNLQVKHQDEDPYSVGILDDVLGTASRQRRKLCSPIASGNYVGETSAHENVHMHEYVFFPRPLSMGDIKSPLRTMGGVRSRRG